MIIFGVDPGIADTGWAVIEGNNIKQTLIDSGVIKTAKTTDQSRRLEEIFDSLRKKLKKYKPDILAVEKIFFNTNLKTAMTVAQTHGVVRLAARKAKTSVVEYTPLQVKISMSDPGSPWQNSWSESFYSRFKTEFGSFNRFETLGELIENIFEYISYYNNIRIQIKLKMSPLQFKLQYADSVLEKRGT